MPETTSLNIEVSAEADHVALGLTTGGIAVRVVISRETAAALAEVLVRAASGKADADEE